MGKFTNQHSFTVELSCENLLSIDVVDGHSPSDNAYVAFDLYPSSGTYVIAKRFELKDELN